MAVIILTRSNFPKRDCENRARGYPGSRMPVRGLWALLRARGLVREVSDGEELRELLEGKSVAVDLSIWVVEGLSLIHI